VGYLFTNRILDKKDKTKGWAITGRRATTAEIQQMVQAGDITLEQANRAHNPFYFYEYTEYKVEQSSYSRKKYWTPIKTRPVEQKDFNKWLDAINVKGINKIGGAPVTALQQELMEYTNAIAYKNMENFGFDPNKYKFIWSNGKRAGAYADAYIMEPTIVNGYKGAGRIMFYPNANLNSYAMSKYMSDPAFAEKTRVRLFKTAVHESLHLVDWCLNDHLDAYMNLEMATYERYGYRVLSYGRYTAKENGRYVAEIMNIRTGQIYNPTGWTPELYMDKKAFDEALALYEKELKAWLKKTPNASEFEIRHFFKKQRPQLSDITYSARIADGNKTIDNFTKSKVGGAKATKDFREPNINNTKNPWTKPEGKAVKPPKQSALKKPVVKKAIQASATTQAWTIARTYGTEIKRRAILAFQFGKNVGMDDGQLLNHIRENLSKYTANPNNLGGNVVANGSINNGRMKAFKNYEYRLSGYEYNAILDARTSETCEYLHGKTILVKDGEVPEMAPPNHFGCRSILIPITITDKQPEQWTGFEWDKVQKAQAENKMIKVGKKTLDPTKILKQKNL